MDWDIFTITTIIIWAGSFAVVAIDSVMQGIKWTLFVQNLRMKKNLSW